MLAVTLLLLCVFTCVYGIIPGLDTKDLEALTKFGDFGLLLELGQIFKGEIPGVCTQLRPTAKEMTFCGDIEGSLPAYVFRLRNSPWKDINSMATKLYDMMSACLANVDDPATQECQDTTRDFICRTLYPPCDPVSHRPKPFCRDDCKNVHACIKAPLCTVHLANQLSCDIGTRKRQMLPFGWSQATDEATGKPYYYTFDSVKVQWEVPTEPYMMPEAPAPTPAPVKADPQLFVSSDPEICKPFYKHGNVATVDVALEHQAGCTLVPTSTHRCARDGYLRLNGKLGDVYLHEREIFVRTQPPGSDPEDARVATMVTHLRDLAAHTFIRIYDKQPVFGAALAKVVFTPGEFELECSFTDELEQIAYKTTLPGGGSFRFITSIAKNDRIVELAPPLEPYVVTGGAFKFTIEIDGGVFQGGWPTESDFMIMNLFLATNQFPINYGRDDTTNSANTFVFSYVDSSVFTVSLLKYAKTDEQDTDRLYFAYSPQLAGSLEALTQKCLTAPVPVSVARFERTMFYDPDISFVYRNGNGNGHTQKELGDDDEPKPLVDDGKVVSSNDGDSSGVVVAVVVCTLVVCVLCAILAFLARRKSREQKAAYAEAEHRIREFNSGANNGGGGTAISTLPSAMASARADSDFDSSRQTPTASATYTTDANSTWGASSHGYNGNNAANTFASIDNSNTFASIDNNNNNQQQQSMYAANNNNGSAHAPAVTRKKSSRRNVARKKSSRRNMLASDEQLAKSHYAQMPQPPVPAAVQQPVQQQQQQQQQQPTQQDQSQSLLLAAGVHEAARGRDPRALAAAVKALVMAARPATGSALHAKCVLLGREARDACMAMPTAPLGDAQVRRLCVGADDVAALMP